VVDIVNTQKYLAMTVLQPSNRTSPQQAGMPNFIHSPKRQQGVVLIVALILLVIISLLAVTNMRSAGSAESVAGNVRTTELATQAAEIALRHCEKAATKYTKVTLGSSTNPELANYDVQGLDNGRMIWASTAGQWQSTTIWDSTSTLPYVLTTTTLGTGTYKRPPECMVESLTGATAVSANAAFIITARGFGPEVAAADASRTRPQGTEVWLQSTIEIE
jgi:type IV pilus assembly protein PilX